MGQLLCKYLLVFWISPFVPIYTSTNIKRGEKNKTNIHFSENPLLEASRMIKYEYGICCEYTHNYKYISYPHLL